MVVLPDCVRETFLPATEMGGEDGADGRGLRYLMWTWDPDRADCTYEVVFAFLLREADGRIRVEKDSHRCGCFPRADWLAWFEEAGLNTKIHNDPWNREVFIGVKREPRISSVTALAVLS